MRLKKQKRHRRAVRFYTACFGFRQPFKVLCDGTFVHHLFVNSVMPADNALSELLGGSAKLFTTRCVLAELESLSRESRKKNKKNSSDQNSMEEKKGVIDPYFESFKAARNLAIARCDHEKSTSADACIMEVIGPNNPEHFFVATQDMDMRKKFQQLPGVPVLFGLRNALLIEPPSASQRHFVKSSEEQRLHLTKEDYKMLDKVKKKLATGEEANDEEGAEISGANEGSENQQAVVKTKISRKSVIGKDRPQFKRKRAKGPNPLSCKKKKNQSHSNSQSKEGKDGDGTVRSRSRKRKRSHKGKKGTEGDG